MTNQEKAILTLSKHIIVLAFLLNINTDKKHQETIDMIIKEAQDIEREFR